MKHFKADLITIYRSERSILALILLNFLFSVGLLIFSITHLDPSGVVVKVGYGDIGGYRDGAWFEMLAFPLLAIVFGVLHGLLSLRIFHKYGGGMTRFFLVITTSLILGAFLVQLRLVGER